MKKKVTYPIPEEQIYTEWDGTKPGTYSPPVPYHIQPDHTKQKNPVDNNQPEEKQ